MNSHFPFQIGDSLCKLQGFHKCQFCPTLLEKEWIFGVCLYCTHNRLRYDSELRSRIINWFLLRQDENNSKAIMTFYFRLEKCNGFLDVQFIFY